MINVAAGGYIEQEMKTVGVRRPILSALRAQAKRGLVTLGVGGAGALYPALPRKSRRQRSAAQLLDDERGPR